MELLVVLAFLLAFCSTLEFDKSKRQPNILVEGEFTYKRRTRRSTVR
jgi:hypothetical protein